MTRAAFFVALASVGFAREAMSAATDAINQAIADNVAGPASVTIGGQTVAQKNVRELIDAANHLAGNDGMSQPHRGLRFTKLLSPGGAR